jgi:hypothetical protein
LLFVNETKCWSREKKIAVLGFKIDKGFEEERICEGKMVKNQARFIMVM